MPECMHLDLATEDGVTFTCVACGHAEKTFTAKEVREYLGLPPEEPVDA